MAIASEDSSATTPTVPQNLQAERGLLGGMLLDNAKISEIVEKAAASLPELGLSTVQTGQ